MNPAYSFNPFLENTLISANLKFRDQWNSVSAGDTYSTAKVNVDYNVYNSSVDGFNLGVLFLSDRSNTGYLKNTSFQVLGSYTRKLTEGRGINNSQIITVGSSFSFAQTTTDLEQFWFSRHYNLNKLEIDKTLNSGEDFRINNYTYNDLNLGAKWMMIYDEKRYLMIGLSSSHTNQPSVESTNSTFQIPRRIVFQAEASLELSEKFNHIPGLLYVKQSPSWQLVPSYHFSADIYNEDNPFALVTGISSRIVNSIDGVLMDAILLDIGLTSSTWSFRFNFDINISPIRVYTNGNGAIELSLGYKIPSK